MGIRSQALSSGPTLGGAALRLWCRTRPDRPLQLSSCGMGTPVRLRLQWCCVDERVGAGREVLAELVELSRRHAARACGAVPDRRRARAGGHGPARLRESKRVARGSQGAAVGHGSGMRTTPAEGVWPGSWCALGRRGRTSPTDFRVHLQCVTRRPRRCWTPVPCALLQAPTIGHRPAALVIRSMRDADLPSLAGGCHEEHSPGPKLRAWCSRTRWAIPSA
jgi:hypothetical protein